MQRSTSATMSMAVCAAAVCTCAALLLAEEPNERIVRVENALPMSPFRVVGEQMPLQTLSHMMKGGGIPGLSFAVVDNGRIAWAKGYGVADLRTGAPVTTETMFSAGGITKAVTALATLRLVDAGKVSLDRDVNSLLVHWKIPHDATVSDRAITLRQLLSHSSGIGQHFPTSYGVGEATPTLLDVLRGEPPAKSTAVEIVHAPGTKFDYSSAAFLVVQQCLTDVTGEPFPDIVKREIFLPAGMTHSTFAQPGGEGDFKARATAYFGSEPRFLAFPELASAGLWTTPSDLARLLIALHASGRPGGLLSSKSYEELLTPVVNNVGLGVFLAGSGDSLRIRVRGTDGTSHDGYAAFLTGYARQGKGAIVMSNTNGLKIGFALMRSIAAEYGWPDYIPVRTVYAVEPAHVKPYLGNFEVDGGVIAFAADQQGLYIQMGPRQLRLLRTAPDIYVTNIDMFNEVEFRFVRTEKDQIDNIVMAYPTHTYIARRVR